jgi:phenylacetate-CoA ligase
MTNVPGYADHLRGCGYVSGPVATFEDFAALPTTDKANYLRTHTVDELMWNGDITGAGTWSSTSGSSGNPTYFPRDELALAEAAGYHRLMLGRDFAANRGSTLVIVCYAMGTWIGGTYTYQALLRLRESGHRLSVVTPGIEIDTIVKTLTDLAPSYDRVVLAGYPPFVKDVLDHAPAHALTQDISFIFAGEAISERWRDHFLSSIGHIDEPDRVCLIYGTAEAGVMGHETPTTIETRRLAETDSALERELFGDNRRPQPTFVQYAPDSRFVEVDSDGYLLFTIDSSLPLVRYRINDQGRVLTSHQVQTALRNFGYTQAADRVDPGVGFIVLTGRPDIATIFYSLNVYPDDLRPAFEDPRVMGSLTGKFRVTTHSDVLHNQVLRIDAELTEKTTASDELASALSQLCVRGLVTNNGEYRALHDRIGSSAEPRVTLHAFRTGPFGKGIKNPYVEVSR